MVFGISLLFTFYFSLKSALKDRPSSALQTVESQWKAGTLRDPIEAMIIFQKEADRRIGQLDPRLWVASSLAFSLAIPIGLSALSFLAMYLYPAYVFCWGDEAKRYKARVQTRNYVLGAILLTLVLGIIASIIGNKLTPGR